MTNILKNASLQGFRLDRHFWDNSGNTGSIEFPTDWEFVVTPMHPDDPGRIPQSLHRDNGFVISAGYRSWEAGYVQRNVPLRGGQRYLAKAQFLPDVNFPPGQQEDLSAIMWRFWIEQSGGGARVFKEWEMTSKGAFKQREECLFVFEAGSDMLVDYYFKARSVWPGNTCDLHVYALTLEEVPPDYGGAGVPILGAASVAPTAPPAPTETPSIASDPAPAADVARLEKLDLADVLTPSDIDVIVAGLRRMETLTSDKIISEAFIRLADALDKLR